MLIEPTRKSLTLLARGPRPRICRIGLAHVDRVLRARDRRVRLERALVVERINSAPVEARDVGERVTILCDQRDADETTDCLRIGRVENTLWFVDRVQGRR